MFVRFLKNKIKFAIENSPVVIVNGARQSGKSTIMKMLIDESFLSNYYTLDDIQTISNLANFPQKTLEQMPIGSVIDEIQKQPQIFESIKLIVDNNRANSRFVLTGSANILLLPKLSESLTGRVQVLSLEPLSIAESLGKFVVDIWDPVEIMFANDFNKIIGKIKFELIDDNKLEKLLVRGLYPELQTKESPEQWSMWQQSYLNTLIQRDVRDIMTIENLAILPNMLRLIAYQTSGILNKANMARDLALNAVTFARYLTALEHIFLVKTLEPYYKNLGKRLVKAPKVYLSDTGLCCNINGLEVGSLIDDRIFFGKILENLIFCELTKNLSWSKIKVNLFYLRMQDGKEIDFILENTKGALVGIEVKIAEAIKPGDIKSLVWLRDTSPDFIRGFVFYSGNKVFEITDKIWVVPISFLWNGEALS